MSERKSHKLIILGFEPDTRTADPVCKLFGTNDPDNSANCNCQFPGSNLSLILARLKLIA